MNAGPPYSDSSQPAASLQTLGEVLYGADFRQRTPETDWIAIIRGIVGGDTFALGRLYTMSSGIVFTLILRITGSREIAEELTVDVFHEVWLSARNYNPSSGSVVGWLMNLARSHALARRRTGHEKNFARTRAAVMQLTRDERRVIEGTFRFGLNSVEIAVREAEPVAAIGTRLHAILGKLRELLAGAVVVR